MYCLCLFLLSLFEKSVCKRGKESLRADVLELHSHGSQEGGSDSRVDEVPTHQWEEFLMKTVPPSTVFLPVLIPISKAGIPVNLWLWVFRFIFVFSLRAAILCLSILFLVLLGIYLYWSMRDAMGQTVFHLNLILTHFKEVKANDHLLQLGVASFWGWVATGRGLSIPYSVISKRYGISKVFSLFPANVSLTTGKGILWIFIWWYCSTEATLWIGQ